MDKFSILEQRIRQRIERTKNQLHESHNRAYNRTRYAERGLNMCAQK
jgi:hypothetical protein